MSLFSFFKKSPPVRTISAQPPPPPPAALLSISMKNLLNQATESSTRFIDLANTIKKMVENAKELVLVSVTARIHISHLASLDENSQKILAQIEILRTSGEQPSMAFEELAVEIKRHFQTIQNESTSAYTAFTHFFQLTRELDQILTKTTDILLDQATSLEHFNKSIQSLDRTQAPADSKK